MQLHFRSYGTGQPLMVLHGLFGSLENWAFISRELGHHFQVLALDLRNHGRSPHADEMSYPLMAADVLETMRAQGIGRALLLGHSMGGKVAMQCALSFPDAVSGLVVVDIAPRAYPPLHRRILDALLSLDLQRYTSRKQIEDDLADAIPDLAVRRFLLKSLETDNVGGFRWRMGLKQIHTNYSALGAALDAPGVYSGPALFVRGERSDYLTSADMAKIQMSFPTAELRTIAGADHWVHAENPAGFLESVLPFLTTSGHAKRI